MHFARLVEQASVTRFCDLYVYYRLGCDLFVYGAYKYLGGYALEQVHDKVEVEGKELPFRKKKKLPQQSFGLARTSSGAMEH